MTLPESAIAAKLGAMMLMGIMTVEAGAAAVIAKDPTIMGDQSLRLYCIVGSVLGAILAVSLFPPADNDAAGFVRKLALKFGSSGIIGVLGCPMAIRYMGWGANEDVVLAVSGALAAAGVWMIHLLIPYAETAIRKRAERISQERDSK